MNVYYKTSKAISVKIYTEALNHNDAITAVSEYSIENNRYNMQAILPIVTKATV